MATTPEIAIVGWAQTPMVRRTEMTETMLLVEAISKAIEPLGLTRADIDFTCLGSCDYITGQAFSFVQNLDALGAWPPKQDSHVEMDGAWALYEAWLRLQHGDIEIAVVTGSGRSSTGDPTLIYPMEMDPYYLATIGADPLTFAALQARAVIGAGITNEREMAEVAVRCRSAAKNNPDAQVSGDSNVDELLATDYVRAPLRRHDLPPITDGAVAMVLATGDRARQLVERPAWITGLDHRTECHNPAFRDLTDSPATRKAGEVAGVGNGPIEVAELQSAFTHEEIILRRALGLADDVVVNASGGPLATNPIMATGLARIGYAANHIFGGGKRALAHSTSGPCLQQNLVCVLEGDQ
ncbi:MAG TPA: lipid-transfer protein [Ilumatobacteraceae bacterium]|nr:lipid-transfer protein [Ilumatobacteraceae bacterium]